MWILDLPIVEATDKVFGSFEPLKQLLGDEDLRYTDVLSAARTVTPSAAELQMVIVSPFDDSMLADPHHEAVASLFVSLSKRLGSQSAAVVAAAFENSAVCIVDEQVVKAACDEIGVSYRTSIDVVAAMLNNGAIAKEQAVEFLQVVFSTTQMNADPLAVVEELIRE